MRSPAFNTLNPINLGTANRSTHSFIEPNCPFNPPSVDPDSASLGRGVETLFLQALHRLAEGLVHRAELKPQFLQLLHRARVFLRWAVLLGLGVRTPEPKITKTAINSYTGD
jgi:hypothetical protein